VKILKIVSMIVILSFVFTGCTFKAGYNPSYVKEISITDDKKIQGMALVYMPQKELEYTFIGNPVSLTGSGTKLELPLGEITKGVTVKTLNGVFENGADYLGRVDDSGKYTLILLLHQ
jgi:hypothetical protein